ncbi:MAG: hypothetical protein ABII90_14510 [Bacteroidota bacterium]
MFKIPNTIMNLIIYPFQSIFLIFLLLISSVVFSQDINIDTLKSKKISLKLYVNTSYEINESSTYNSLYQFTTNKSDKDFLWNLSAAIAFENKKGNNHEIELSQLEFSRQDDETVILYDTASTPQIVSGQRVATFNILIRYNYNQVFFKNKNFKIKPNLGASISPFYNIIATFPEISGFHSTKYRRIGTAISLTPGANWDINKRFYFDLNIPIDIVEGALRINKNDDPSLPEKVRRVSTYDIQCFPIRFQFRIGIGLKI